MQIEPRKSIGCFRLGDDINVLKEKFVGKHDIFKRVPNSEDSILSIDQINVHLTFGKDNKIKVISIFEPNFVEYKGVSLLGKLLSTVRNELIEIGIITDFEDAGLWIEEASILLVEVEEMVDGVELYPD